MVIQKEATINQIKKWTMENCNSVGSQTVEESIDAIIKGWVPSDEHGVDLLISALKSNKSIDHSVYPNLKQFTLIGYAEMCEILDNHNKILADF